MFIEFGILSYKLLFILLYPIFYQIRTKISFKDSSPLFNSFMSFMSYLSAGLIYLFVICRIRSTKNVSSSVKNIGESSKLINQIYLIKIDVVKQHKIKKITRLFLLSLINITPMIVEASSMLLIPLKYKEIFSESLEVLSATSFYLLFSKIFFKTKIYRHHIISLFIIFFCLLFLLCIDFIKICIEFRFSFIDFGKSLVYFILVFGLYSLYDVLVKKYFQIYGDVPYYLMFFVGLFSLILIIPIDIFVIFFPVFGSHIIEQIKDLCKYFGIILFILWFILDTIVGLFMFLGIILTLYYFTPFHFIISQILLQFFSKCIDWIINNADENNENNEWYLKITYILIYTIIIFSSLIYYEVIIIKLWNLERNTFKYISFRQRLESDDLQDNYDENTSENITEDSRNNSLILSIEEEEQKEDKQEKEI